MHISVKNKAIVIGGNHYNTLGVIRSLGEKGVPVYLILISEKENYICKSKYVTKFWQVIKSEKEIINVLLNNFDDEEFKPVIMPTSDFGVEVLDKNFNLFKNKYILPNIDNLEGKITYLMNKKIMNEIAFESGLTVPKSFEVELNNKEICLPEEIIYPCIVKPLSSIDGKKEDIVVCKNELELKKSLLDLKQDYHIVLIQEYIYGPDSKMIEIIGCVTTNGKEIIIPAIIEKIREYPLMAGSTSYALATTESQYINNNNIHAFMKKLNYTGIFDLEFKYANGKTYFIEINFRNGAPGYALTKRGINIPYIWYLEATGQNIDNINKKISENFNFMMEVRDFRHVLKGDVKIYSWIKDLINTKVFLFFNFKDMKPAISRIVGK